MPFAFQLANLKIFKMEPPPPHQQTGVCIQEPTMHSAPVVYSMNIVRLMGAKFRPDDVQKLIKIYDYFIVTIFITQA